MLMRSIHTFAIVTLAAVTLVSCSPKIKNFAIGVSSVDETSPQARAMIRLSDPQVYSREALINDRMQERKHLDSLLTKSADLSFEPQIARELSAVSVLSGQLGVSANPAAGLRFKGEAEDFNRASEIRRLSQEIETTKLLGELTRTQQALKELQEGKGQGPGAPENKTGTPTAPTFQPQSLGTAITSLVDSLNKRADTLSKSLETKAQTTSLKGTPEDSYDDLSAYRSRLRADLASASLDDSHDLSGNTLYRFQFRATVLPGENKNKWGVLRASAVAPEMNDGDIRRLYFSWLAHANRRLNIFNAKGEVDPVAQYARLGASGKLFEIAEVKIKEKTLFLAVMNGFGEIFERFSSEMWTRKEIEKKAEAYKKDPEGVRYLTSIQRFLLFRYFNHPSKRTTPASQRIMALSLSAANNVATEVLEMAPSVEAIVAGLGDLGLLPNEIRPAATQLLEAYDLAFEAAVQHLRDPSHAANSAKLKWELAVLIKTLDIAEQNQEPVTLKKQIQSHISKKIDQISIVWNLEHKNIIDEQSRKIPERFCSAILTEEKPQKKRNVCLDRGDKASGQSYSYAAMPAQQAQRISTVASVADSVQMALALAAAVPQSGVNVEAALGSLRSSIGKVQGLERAPLVVGFADGAPPSVKKQTLSADNQSVPSWTDKHAHFGWVFGPRLNLDPKQGQLELAHTVANYQVTADLSIPSWWPRLELSTETAWIQNWYAPKELDYLDKGKNDTVVGMFVGRQLPLSQGSLDAITDRLLEQIFKQGIRNAQIYKVTPDKVSYCTEGPIELLAYGANLWRSPEVFLRGRKHEDVRVLPDMAGIAAKFTIKNLPKHGTPDELIVVTQVGASKAPIIIDETCEKKPTTPTIKVVGNRFINNESLTIEVESEKIAGVHFGMTIGVRPSETGNSISWEHGAADPKAITISSDAKKITGRPKIILVDQDPWKQPAKDGKNTLSTSGTLFDVALLMDLKPKFVPTEYKAENRVVFYRSRCDASAQLKIVRFQGANCDARTLEIAGLTDALTIELPVVYWEAYPKLGTVQFPLKGKIDGQDIVLEVIQGEFPKDRSRDYTFKLAVPDKDKKLFNDLRKQRDLTVKLQFEGEQPHVPEVMGTIKIKKSQ